MRKDISRPIGLCRASRLRMSVYLMDKRTEQKLAPEERTEFKFPKFEVRLVIKQLPGHVVVMLYLNKV